MIKRPKPKRFNGKIRFDVVRQITLNSEMPKHRYAGLGIDHKVMDSITFTKDEDVRVVWNSAYEHYQVLPADCISNGEMSEWIWVSRKTMRLIFTEGAIKIIESK
jgi:hypothetical protein